MKKKKILITGGNGLLGQKLVYKLREKPEVDLIATARGENRLLEKTGYAYCEMDITDAERVEKLLNEIAPECIIHTAAMTNVDACELNPDECERMNVTAVSNLVEAAGGLPKPPQFIHLSTDFIFDGAKGHYSEEDEPAPLSIYGQSKLRAEQIVQSYRGKWCILRTVLVYGITENLSRSNIVLWAKNSLEKGQKINVVNDQFRTPTLAEDLADGCILAALKEATGIYNISGKDYMSVLELVQRVANFWKLDKELISPASSSSIKQPAKRPPNTGFDISKAVKELGYRPHSFEEGLAIVDHQLSATSDHG